jgi:hypothetical protein
MGRSGKDTRMHVGAWCAPVEKWRNSPAAVGYVLDNDDRDVLGVCLVDGTLDILKRTLSIPERIVSTREIVVLNINNQ